MESKNYLVLAVILITAKGTSADIEKDIGTLVVLQIQTDDHYQHKIPEGVIRFTHKLLDREHSVQRDMESILVPYDGLYEIDIRGGRFFVPGHIDLNINGDVKKEYVAFVGGASGDSMLRLENFQMGTIMTLKERDLIRLTCSKEKQFGVHPYYEFSLTLKRLA